MIKYNMNLVKSLREAERRHQRHRAWALFLFLAAVGALALSGAFAFVRVASMEMTLKNERKKLERIEAEYRTYQEAQSVIDKADIELLYGIQSSRIYWTRKLEAMASHLPEAEPISYWITKFGYRGGSYAVSGYGYITERQEQLLALDDYLNRLRADPSWSDVFGATHLRSAARSDEDGGARGGFRERVSFEYVSTGKGGAR